MNQETKNSILNNLQTLQYIGFEYLEPIKLNKTIIKEEELPNEIGLLHDIVLNCNLCSLSKSRKNILFGSGNADANIMFLKLSPTHLEDESGNIFSGKSGEMLVNMCKNILDLNIDDIYVTNILKCFSKDIVDKDVNTCKSYIYKQIELIKPNIIITFGRAYEYLINETKSLKEIRGIVQNYNNIKVMPTFDPSYILRNPSFKKDVLEDLQKVKILMESI